MTRKRNRKPKPRTILVFNDYGEGKFYKTTAKKPKYFARVTDFEPLIVRNK